MINVTLFYPDYVKTKNSLTYSSLLNTTLTYSKASIGTYNFRYNVTPAFGFFYETEFIFDLSSFASLQY